MIFDLSYFYIALLLFLIYFVVISIFGFIIFTLIDKNFRKKKVSLTLILKSFAIGVSSHLSYSIIILFLKIFNFFTVYLPFIMFDIISLIYIYFKTDVIKKIVKSLKKSVILNYLKQNKDYILILSIIFIMQFLLQMYYFNKSIGYAAQDPYFWFGGSWFVHENSYLSPDYYLKNYPPGYILFCCTISSLIDDYYIFFFFLKFLPSFLMSINILVIFQISRKIFLNKINIFFSLAILLSFNYLMYRYLLPLSSNLATTLCFLLLLFLNKSIITNIKSNNYQLKTFTKRKLTDKNSIFKGLIFSGILLVNPIYFLYYLTCYLSFEFCLFIMDIVHKKRFTYGNIPLGIRFFIAIFSILLYTILFSLSYHISSAIYSGSPGTIFSYYFKRLIRRIFINNFIFHKKSNLFFLEDFMEFLKDFGAWIEGYIRFFAFFDEILFEKEPLSIFEDFFKQTLSLGILFVVLGVFLKFGKIFNFKEKQNYLNNFFRFTFIFTILITIIIYLMEMIEIKIIQYLSNILITSHTRLFELFAGFWAIIFVLSVNYIFKFIKNLYFKVKKTNIAPNERLIKFFKLFQLISIIFLGGVLYISNFERTHYAKTPDNDRIDAVLFIGNYFSEHPLDEETTILLEDLEDKNLFHLLENKDLKKTYYQFKHDADFNYSNFKDYFEDNDCEYILIKKKDFEKEDCMEDFEEDFNEIYENSEFIFAKID